MDFDIFFDTQNNEGLTNPSFMTFAQSVDQAEPDASFQTTYKENLMNSALDLFSSNDSVAHPISAMGASSFPSQNFLLTPLGTPNYCTPLIHPCVENLEELLVPLVSPAITPNYTEIQHFRDSPINEHYFTPLSSPALAPDSSTLLDATYQDEQANTLQDTTSLQQQLAHIEAKQQLLRDQMKTSPAISPNYKKSPLVMYSKRQQAPPSPIPTINNKKRPSLRQQIALASPQLHSSQNHPTLPTIPATPASLMRMSHHLHPSLGVASATLPSHQQESDKAVVDLMPSLPPAAVGLHGDLSGTPMARSTSLPTNALATKKRKLAPSPRTLKPLLSPFLQPDLRASVPIIAANNVGLENRRSAHKVAEQRRRDTLKQSFDSLRKEITEVLVAEAKLQPELSKSDEVIHEEKEKEVRFMSKVLLLQHSYEYILRLKNDSKQKDKKLSSMEEEIQRLKSLLENKT
ncbi:hypothetical protein EDC96DRAFT_519651 [Choanephora cucurbitarum]|nr:hypothetical protein EDC96DRAFT_519651 [Choanephora cucurbitarum]